MALFDSVANLPLEIDSYELEGREQPIAPNFTRRTTVIRLRGGGLEGVGEDVTYDEGNQLALQEEGPTQPFGGSHTFESFSQLLERLNLFPSGPARDDFTNYRRWAFESAALDLALRQAGRTLAEAVDRTPQQVRFVASLRLGEPATLEPVRGWLALYPRLHFKLDPTSSWTETLVAELVEAARVDIVDLKGAYHGTPVDNPPDPTLYARVAVAFPDAWIEDPALTEETDPVLAPHRNRITWDAPIHSVADIRGLPFPPRTLNIKPSRFGSVRALFETYDYCAENGIRMYGGGQFELGPGRGQIQYLASLFHAAMPNDVAPRGFNEAEPRAGLPSSPLDPSPGPVGFYWAEAEPDARARTALA